MKGCLTHIVIVFALAILSASCHTTKSGSQASATMCDSASVSESQTSSSYDATMANSLRLVLDSLDMWIYDYPFIADRVPRADSVYQPETPKRRDKDMPKGYIHITAKKAALDNIGSTEIHSRNDSLSTSVSAAHTENSESAATTADTTAVAKPPDMTWVFVTAILATLIFAVAIAYFKRK